VAVSHRLNEEARGQTLDCDLFPRAVSCTAVRSRSSCSEEEEDFYCTQAEESSTTVSSSSTLARVLHSNHNN
jgi:hypothetical protein